jgi:hypothetical protein
MITVYLKSGQSADVEDAVSVEIVNGFATPGAGTGVPALACKDEDGNTVGLFMLDAVSGYAIGEDYDDDYDEDEDD